MNSERARVFRSTRVGLSLARDGAVYAPVTRRPWKVTPQTTAAAAVAVATQNV